MTGMGQDKSWELQNRMNNGMNNGMMTRWGEDGHHAIMPCNSIVLSFVPLYSCLANVLWSFRHPGSTKQGGWWANGMVGNFTGWLLRWMVDGMNNRRNDRASRHWFYSGWIIGLGNDGMNTWAADEMTDRTTGRMTERTTSRTTDRTSDIATRLPIQSISSGYFSYPIYGGDQTSLAHSSSSVQR